MSGAFSAYAAAIRHMVPRQASTSAPKTQGGVTIDTILAKLVNALPGVPIALPAKVVCIARGLVTVDVEGAAFVDVPVECIRFSRPKVGADCVLLVSSDGPICAIVGLSMPASDRS